MKPDLTYYHNSLLPLKNYLYFPPKKLKHTSRPKAPQKIKFPLKKFLIFFRKKVLIF